MKRKFKLEMLVRDLRLKWMQERGMDVEHHTLSDAEFDTHLRNKIIEEAGELVLEKTKEGITEELADLYEICEYFKNHHNITESELQAARKEKVEKLGTFDQRIYTSSMEIDSDNPAIQHYLDRPEKYPEIKKAQIVR